MKAFSFSYYVRLANTKQADCYRLIGRITVNGKRTEFSLNRQVSLQNWNQKTGQLKGRDKETKELEKFLATVNETFYRLERELIEKSIPITGENLIKAYQNSLTGNAETRKTLFEIFDLHNTQMAQLSAKGEIVSRTVTRYNATKNYLKEFLAEKYKRNDIALDDLVFSFVLEFDHWIRTQKNCAHNTTIKYIKNLRKVIKMAVDYGWLTKDPFSSYKAKAKIVNRESLTADELKRIENLSIEIPRLNKVKKWFLFSCYTGLSYIDITSLTQENVRIDNNDTKWIVKERKKTKIVSRIILFPKAEDILNDFSKDPAAIRKGVLFPPMSNQRLNSYLKEISDLAKIGKNLTFHIARHTFATTVTLANGVSLETVSAQLGHTNIRQTQHYAKMVDARIKREMESIKELFTN